MKKILIAALAVATLALAACSSKESVSFNTLEDARQQARANAEFNATQYRSENPRMQGLKIVGHGDSTQTAECPQGDGWASLSIMSAEKDSANHITEKYKVKCSTVSSALGCYLESDFEKKPFAKQENQCDRTLPFPLPKIAK